MKLTYKVLETYRSAAKTPVQLSQEARRIPLELFGERGLKTFKDAAPDLGWHFEFEVTRDNIVEQYGIAWEPGSKSGSTFYLIRIK